MQFAIGCVVVPLMEQSQCFLATHAILPPVRMHVVLEGIMHVLFFLGVRPDLGV